MKQTLLSDNQPIEVRRLLFLELETEMPWTDDPGPYIHYYEVDRFGEKVVEPVLYTLEDFGDTVPEMPDTPEGEAQPDTVEAALWDRFRLYRAVVLQEQKRAASWEQHKIRCALYILKNCIGTDDRKRIVTPDDYLVVYNLALFPEVRMEDLATSLAGIFPGILGRPAGIRGAEFDSQGFRAVLEHAGFRDKAHELIRTIKSGLYQYPASRASV